MNIDIKELHEEARAGISLDRRRQWVANHVIIQDAYFGFLSEHKRMPTLGELEQLTGLGDRAIRNHLEEFDKEALLDRTRIFSERVLTALAAKAASGNVAAIKLYWEIVNNWSPTTRIEQTVKGAALTGKTVEEMTDEELDATEAALERGSVDVTPGGEVIGATFTDITNENI